MILKKEKNNGKKEETSLQLYGTINVKKNTEYML